MCCLQSIDGSLASPQICDELVRTSTRMRGAGKCGTGTSSGMIKSLCDYHRLMVSKTQTVLLNPYYTSVALVLRCRDSGVAV